MKYFDITFGEHSEVSIKVTASQIKKGIGYNPILNEAIQALYKEFMEVRKTKPTIGMGFSMSMGFRNLSIYEVF